MKTKFLVMGVPEGEDFPSFEKQIPIALKELSLIMGCTKDEDPLHDYLLTEQHLTAIEKACSIKLPANLNFFLTSYD